MDIKQEIKNNITSNPNYYGGDTLRKKLQSLFTKEERVEMIKEIYKKVKKISNRYIVEDRIEELYSNGLVENGNIQVFDLSANLKDSNNNNPLTISISKIGGHIVNMNYNREVNIEEISYEYANKIGIEFLKSRGIENMTETYYLIEEGIITVNYAYEQDSIVVYPDLIKLKIALDNGEVLGIETSGYLNNHTERNISNIKISQEEAKRNLNKNLKITSEKMAIIPTEWKTEILCYEFKGKIEETDFLVYINS